MGREEWEGRDGMGREGWEEWEGRDVKGREGRDGKET